ncbi:hypothetical protein ACKQTC_07335 [Peptococcus simiae]|uniref:RecT family protein n=1 Tax=Peptococcus simiae TaxID=1643805 RepID=A0ABW9H037_9FIRM
MENNKMMEKVANESQAPVTMGYNTLEGFKLMQRVAQMFAQSSLVPKNYQGNISDCVIALNMAQRMKADPLMVMQNLYIVNGRPSFSSSFLIATFNASGRFSSMQFEFAGTKDDAKCRAYAKELDSGILLQGSWVSIQLAKDEGWYDKTDRNGKPVSKWRTMPQQMLMYRAAAFFIRAYAPEIAMGMYTTDEVEDFIDVESPQAAVPKEPVKPQPIKQEEAPVLDFEEAVEPQPIKEEGVVDISEEVDEESDFGAEDLFSDLEPGF